MVILDEPTAARSVPQQNKVLELTRQLASQGVAVVYITNNMDDASPSCTVAKRPAN